MINKILLFLLGVSLLLSACQGNQATSEAPAAGETPAVTAESFAASPSPASQQAAQPDATSAAASVKAANCTVVSTIPTPGPTEQSLFPPVGEGDWTKGLDTAEVTFTEYSDFMCPGCAQLAPVLAQLQADYPEQIRIAYRHFPLLSIHDKAALATQASEAAGIQGKFWEMHDVLMERQSEWTGLSVDEFKAWLADRAGELGLDAAQFETDLNSEATAAIAQKGWDDGVAANLPGTPLLLINGQYYGGPTDYASLESIVKVIQLEDRQFTECPPMTIDPDKQYTATLKTEKGDIVIELLPKVAPMAVNSLIFLANNDWFDGVTFHRVLPGFVAQAGDPTGTGLGGPGYAFENEVSPDYNFDEAGVVGMANAGPGSNGSQFFITLGPATNLNGGYTVFGRVISGMEVVNSLAPRDPQQSAGLPPGDKILDVVIEEK